MQPDNNALLRGTAASAASASQTPRIAVLVSVGRHPLTGRPRRAEQDARAVEAALSLARADAVTLIHCGEPVVDEAREVALRAYLGMGPGAIETLPLPAGSDAAPALVERLRALSPSLVLCGARAETGEASGLLPYLLAEQLGWSLVSGLAAIETVDGHTATVLQALPRGQRRRLRVRLPAILTVDQAAPAARQSAFGQARRGVFRPLPVSAATARAADPAAQWTVAPAKKRPKRLKIVKATSARDRLKAAAAKAEGTGGQVLTGLTPQAGAEAILKLLREEGVLRGSGG